MARPPSLGCASMVLWEEGNNCDLSVRPRGNPWSPAVIHVNLANMEAFHADERLAGEFDQWVRSGNIG